MQNVTLQPDIGHAWILLHQFCYIVRVRWAYLGVVMPVHLPQVDQVADSGIEQALAGLEQVARCRNHREQISRDRGRAACADRIIDPAELACFPGRPASVVIMKCALEMLKGIICQRLTGIKQCNFNQGAEDKDRVFEFGIAAVAT